MSEVRIAKRYAKSLIELAIEQGKLEEVHHDMVNFAQICNANRKFVLMLKNPIINHAKKLAVFNKIFEGKFDETSMKIFVIIAKKHREAVLPAIAREFHNQYNIHKGIQSATLTTAVPLDDGLRKEFQSLLSEITDKTIDLEEVVDESVIGGFKLMVGDRQVDDTIKSKLDALSLKFKEQVYID